MQADVRTVSSRVLFCAMPKSGRGVRSYEAAVAHYHPSVRESSFGKIVRATVESSLLTHGFNKMWAAALTLRQSEGVTHFAMIHDDVATGPGWADVMLSEMERVGADIISAVIPIKDRRGIVSTALDGGDHFSPRRLTVKEVFDREETWTEDGLLVNTGLWLCDLRKDWCEKVIFRQTDQMVITNDGRFIARTNPEDWDFSRQVRALGGKLYATRKVALYHERPDYHNTSVWGEWETDRGDSTATPKVRDAGNPVGAAVEENSAAGAGAAR